MAVRRAARLKPSRPKQVRGLTNAIRTKIVAGCPSTLAGFAMPRSSASGMTPYAAARSLPQ